MIFYYSNHFKGDATFESAGMFFTDEPWRHSYRVITSYEIILLLDGSLPMEINGQNYIVRQNEFFVVPPHTPHGGFADAPDGTRFLWFHFNFGQQELKHIERQQISDSNSTFLQQESEILRIPTHSNKMNMERIMLMATQLLDIYQEKAPQDYLNATLNTILFEISYQSTQQLKELHSNNEMQPIQEWIRIHAFEDITLEKIADHFNYNKNYLSRKYKSSTGLQDTDVLFNRNSLITIDFVSVSQKVNFVHF